MSSCEPRRFSTQPSLIIAQSSLSLQLARRDGRNHFLADPRLPLLSIHCIRPFMLLIRRVNCSRLGETYLLCFPRKIAGENRWFPFSVTDVIILVYIKFFRSSLLIANADLEIQDYITSQIFVRIVVCEQ